MNLSFFKRVKHHHLPGDVSKEEKLAMRERRHPETVRSKIYRQDIALRTRSTLRERTEREIAQQMEWVTRR